MKSRVVNALILLLLIVEIATPAVIQRLRPDAYPAGDEDAMANAGARVDASKALSRYGFYLQQVAEPAGVHFRHQAPQLDPKLNPIMPEIASMGAGVAVADFDRDGWPDFYVTNSGEGSLNALYRNKHDGTFENVAARLGVADVNRQGTGVSMGAVWGDYDNDGWEDLFVYKWGKPELFHNDHGHGFTRVTDKANLPSWINSNTAIWLDYDRDGRLDLFIGGYYPENVDLWHLKTTRIMPESFEYASNGGRKYLLHNRGDGTFEDVTHKMGIDSRRWALAAAAADLRGTGYPDLFVANDYGVSELYLNDHGKRFRDVGRESGVGSAPKSGMNAAFGDILNNGQYAIYVTNISEPGVLLQGNNLWMPDSNGSGPPRYKNVAHEMDVELGGWSFGAQFGDLNNDGNLDLYLTNGYVSLNRNKNYWYDFSKLTGGNSGIIADAANWPPVKGRSHSGYQPKRLWLNRGEGSFTNIAQAVGATDRYDGRAVAMADLWNRGVLDVIVANERGPLLLYKNTVAPGRHWIEFDLEGTGSNRSAIGAEIRLFWNHHQQVQEVSGGSGFCAQNDRRLHFGLGDATHIDKAVIRWPSGRTQTLTAPAIDRLNHIKEPS